MITSEDFLWFAERDWQVYISTEILDNKGYLEITLTDGHGDQLQSYKGMFPFTFDAKAIITLENTVKNAKEWANWIQETKPRFKYE